MITRRWKVTGPLTAATPGICLQMQGKVITARAHPEAWGGKLPHADGCHCVLEPLDTFDVLEQLVDEANCKPGWFFSLSEEDGVLRMIITIEGPDAFEPRRRRSIGHVHPVPYATFTKKTWQGWIYEMCLRSENHEVGEWLRFGSGDTEMRPFLPTHGPGEDPYMRREYRNEDDAFTTQDGSMRLGVGPSGVRK